MVEKLRLILWEKLQLRVLEKGVPRNTCAPEREEVTGDWRRVYTEEVRGFYSSPLYDQIKERGAGHVERMGKRERHAEAWWET